ncbi:MAG: hypothetical protein IIT57_14675, partial [Treponema sp.]|nr:hypothetical protein [Treponema sp.]
NIVFTEKLFSREYPWTPNLEGENPLRVRSPLFFPLQASFNGTHLLPSHPRARLRAISLNVSRYA